MPERFAISSVRGRCETMHKSPRIRLPIKMIYYAGVGALKCSMMSLVNNDEAERVGGQ
jgi:hypothetical protein